MLNAFAEFLDAQNRILLTTHENPDGDGIGAMLGLAHYLRLRGKETRLVVSPAPPANLAFLDPEGWIEPFEPEGRHRDLAEWPGLWLLVDASEPARLGGMLPTFTASKALKACLDHHLKALPGGFDMECADPAASASAELVFELAAPRLGGPLPVPMATAIYAGIVDDTGNFRFSNASPKVHRIAAQLIEQGVDPSGVYQALYHQGSSARMRIFGHAFQGLELIAQDRCGLMALSRADLESCGATHEDLDGLVNKPLELRGVEVAALLYELKDGRFKLSLRSRGEVDVNALCRELGGGGHRLASGAKVDGPLDAARTRVRGLLEAHLAKKLALQGKESHTGRCRP